jgi:hypothetical protein
MALAGVAGIVLLFVAGPLGILVGIAGTVFLSEYLDTGDPGRSARAAAYATVGALGVNLVQAAVAFAMLVAVLVVVL